MIEYRGYLRDVLVHDIAYQNLDMRNRRDFGIVVIEKCEHFRQILVDHTPNHVLMEVSWYRYIDQTAVEELGITGAHRGHPDITCTTVSCPRDQKGCPPQR